MKEKSVEQAYAAAKERYAETGTDTDRVLDILKGISLSLHCWQTDDVAGFEKLSGPLSGGIQATGNYPGRARNIDEVRADILKAMSLIPARITTHCGFSSMTSFRKRHSICEVTCPLMPRPR